jgi:hypothetical protein
MRSTLDISWAAGFLEGEGCFFSTRTTPGIAAVQVQRQPLDKLQSVFGGTIHLCAAASPKRQPYFKWSLYGTNAAAVMMTVLVLMSPKRAAKIKEVIERWKGQGAGKGATHRDATHCPQGHPYSGHNLYVQPSNGGRKCRACAADYRATRRTA